jgi:hypothetical protein
MSARPHRSDRDFKSERAPSQAGGAREPNPGIANLNLVAPSGDYQGSPVLLEPYEGKKAFMNEALYRNFRLFGGDAARQRAEACAAKRGWQVLALCDEIDPRPNSAMRAASAFP